MFDLLGTQKLGNEISLSITVSHHLGPADMSESRDSTGRTLGPVPEVPIKVNLKCRSVIHDVRLMIHVESPLKVSQNVFVFGSVMDGSQAIASVFLEYPFIPSSLKVTAHAVYTNSYGAPRIVDSSALLPLSAVAKACPPVKEGETKVTIDINKKPLLLNEIFPVSRFNANEMDDLSLPEGCKYVDNSSDRPTSASQASNVGESEYIPQDDFSNTFDDMENEEMII
ncbi:hypothetical protein AVEN_30184-1 [Araneus ventricosus]|uniref:Uncharacterized protein n=1 Tax=Araneus ventricosus TaxID=182803 RepID=A0A4Y2DPL6_ARAVE|nr:hypothetical protein AVEN_30184-1 [Araneus ventricosus]